MTRADLSGALTLARLRQQLDAGLQRSRQLGRPILVSSVQSVSAEAPLAFYRRGSRVAAELAFWSCPSEEFALTGVGTAWEFSGDGPGLFPALAAAWADCRTGALLDPPDHRLGTGPILLAGFAFDPSRPRTALWDGFPDSRAVLPRYLFTATPEATWLTTNLRISPDGDVGAELRAIERDWSLLTSEGPVGSESAHPDGRSTRPSATAVATEAFGAAELWQDAVRRLGVMLDRGEVTKVVLARACSVGREEPIDPADVLERLSAAYPSCFVFAVSRRGRCFLGASPERLVRLRAGRVWIACLAGSIARGQTDAEDRAYGAELLASTKNRAEHAVVVEVLRGAVSEVCDEVQVPDAPTLLKVANVQHLFTPIVGRVANGRSVLDLVERLHPTPGVGGHPREAALRWIRAEEELDRGWYAGPVGWLDARGEGEFAVAIRSGLLAGSRATLFAGCGIVAGSDPASEYAESCLKLQPILTALGGGAA